MAKRKRATLSEQIRAAAKASEYSQADLARILETNRSGVSRFMSGEQGLSQERLDKLGELLGLQIVKKR